MKLKNAIYISRNSKRNNIALSAYMSELQSFNVVDKDHDLVGEGGEVDTNSIEMTVQGGGGDGVEGDGIGGHGGIGADDKPIVANLTMI